MKFLKYLVLTLTFAISSILNFNNIDANAEYSSYIDISQKLDGFYFFDIEEERAWANPDTPIPVAGYTDKEVEMICSIVMRETGYGDALSKALVTNVIRNRLKSSKFPNDVESVLTAQNQFPTIINWYTNEWPVTDATRLAVCHTLMSNVDVSNGAIYFYATYLKDSELITWFESQTFCCEHYGQRYFK